MVSGSLELSSSLKVDGYEYPLQILLLYDYNFGQHCRAFHRRSYHCVIVAPKSGFIVTYV